MTALASAHTFRHGVHPEEHKEATESLPIERMRFVDEVVLPLSQHIGAPSKAVVHAGQRVLRGQVIAKPGGFVSTALHAPVTGTVTAIELRPHPNGKRMESIVIRTDPFSGQLIASGKPVTTPIAATDFVRIVQEAGIVGLGGAAFPAHVKLGVPDGKKVRFVMLNGCECEPFLTCDHRIMLERPEAVLRGLRLIMAQVGAERAYIGIERNKPDAIRLLSELTARDPDIEIAPLVVKYPQGAEKMLIDAILKKEVPSGKLPLDLEIVVQNVGTAAAVADIVDQGVPLIERVLTVTGPGIVRPANVLAPLGTPLSAVIDHCGGLRPTARQVILGGPMMGQAQKTLDVPVVKGASGILVLTDPIALAKEEACIRCGRCLTACPMFLNPSRLGILVRAEDPDALKAYHILDCVECASCSFVCPSNIPLVQLMRVGKAIVRQQKEVRS